MTLRILWTTIVVVGAYLEWGWWESCTQTATFQNVGGILCRGFLFWHLPGGLHLDQATTPRMHNFFLSSANSAPESAERTDFFGQAKVAGFL